MYPSIHPCPAVDRDPFSFRALKRLQWATPGLSTPQTPGST